MHRDDIIRAFAPDVNRLVPWRGFLVDPDNLPLPLPGVYLILCLVNGKPYFGISQDVRERLTGHAGGKTLRKLGNAIAKHKPANFLAFPLAYSVDGTTDWLPAFEAEMIAFHDAVKRGYNVQEASGAVGPYGPEFAAIHVARWAKDGERERHSEILTAALNTPEAIARRQANVEAGVYRDASLKMFADRPEVAATISAKSVARWEDDEFRAREMERRSDQEYRDKLSAACIESWVDPKVKAQRGAAISKGKQENPIFWVTDGQTEQCLLVGSPIPEGFVQGRLDNFPDLVWITDGVSTDRIPAADLIPEGWWIGRSDIGDWINDGANARRLKPGEPLPEGWVYGHLGFGGWFNDGVGERRLKPGEPVPDGFVPGRIKGRKRASPRKKEIAS